MITIDKLLNKKRDDSDGKWEVRSGALLITPPKSSEGDSLRAAYREELLALPWITQKTARHECFMSSDGPRSYSYGNRGTGDQEYESIPMTGQVLSLMHYLNARLNTGFNVCFLNKYDNEKQHLGWHADDFEGMLRTEPIACISVGAEREIWVKPKLCPQCRDGAVVDKEHTGENEEGYVEYVDCDKCKGTGKSTGEIPKEQKILLPEFSTFIMPAGYQDTHLHRIPKHGRPCGWRISLTFRAFLPNSH